MRHTNTRRRGFVLLAMLWVMAGVAVLGVGLDLLGRDTVAATRNRIALTRGHWLAEGCIATARAALSRALEFTDSTDAVWEIADTVLAREPDLRSCDLTARPVAITIDVNTITAAELGRFFRAASISPTRTDSLIAALMDWRDPDDIPTPGGAEKAWYTAEGEPLPRNGPLHSPLELRYVRGFARLFGDRPDLAAMMGVDHTPVDLRRAPLPVIAALPQAGDSLLGQAPPVVSATTSAVDEWILTVTVEGEPRSAASLLEVTVARAGTRVAILRQKRWP